MFMEEQVCRFCNVGRIRLDTNECEACHMRDFDPKFRLWLAAMTLLFSGIVCAVVFFWVRHMIDWLPEVFIIAVALVLVALKKMPPRR